MFLYCRENTYSNAAGGNVYNVGTLGTRCDALTTSNFIIKRRSRPGSSPGCPLTVAAIKSATTRHVLPLGAPNARASAAAATACYI